MIAAFVSKDRLRFELQYRKSCFNRGRVEAFGRHLQNMLTAVLKQPDQALHTLEWLSEDDRSLIRGVSLEAPLPSFLELFQQQVCRAPDAIAVGFNGQHLSYAELDRRSSALASHLRRLDIKANDRVGISTPRSPEMVIAILATLKVGAAYVLSISHGRETQARSPAGLQACADTQPQSLARALERQPPPWIECDTFDYSWEANDGWQAAQLQPQNDAYILYTSGSTGRPKGVAMSHAALDNLLAWQLKTSTVGANAKTLQFASIGFDVSFQEIFATLCSGGQLILVTEEQQQDLNRLWKLIVSQQIERLFVPFAALRGCVRSGPSMRTIRSCAR